MTLQELNPRVQAVVERLQTTLQPKSIFLYGSRARGDHRSTSDYELGLIYDGTKISRSDITPCLTEDDVNAYAFSLEDLTTGHPKTPFPPRLFTYEITNGGGVTVTGEHLIEAISCPPIHGRHIIARTNFDTAIALTAMLIARSGDVPVSHEHFYKSCLYGARSMLLYETGVYHLTYHGIAEAAIAHDKEYATLIAKALTVRETGTPASTEDFHENIGFLSERVRDTINVMPDANAKIDLQVAE